jgi:hypothetical protein
MEYKIEGNDGTERSRANAAGQNKIQRKIGAASPKVMVEEYHRPVPQIVHHTQGLGEGQDESNGVCLL